MAGEHPAPQSEIDMMFTQIVDAEVIDVGSLGDVDVRDLRVLRQLDLYGYTEEDLKSMLGLGEDIL